MGVLLFSLVLGGIGGWLYARSQLDATPVAGLSPLPDDGPINTLVTHSESHDSTELLSVAVVQTGREQPVVLQFPLDLEVAVPGGGVATLREAFAEGGRARLLAGVSDYTGLELHQAHHLSLTGLEQLAAELDPQTCRAGSCVADHLERLRRSKELPMGLVDEHAAVLRSLASEAGRSGLLLSPARAKRVLDALPAALLTSLELGPRAAMNSAAGFGEAELAELDVRTVPGYYDPAAALTLPYPERAETLFQALRHGTELPGDLGRTDPREDLLVPEEVRVLVLNGVGQAGLASTVAETLGEAGFDVVGADNLEEFDASLDETEIRHRPDARHRAQLLAAQLPGARLVATGDLPGDVDVVVVVGNDQAQP